MKFKKLKDISIKKKVPIIVAVASFLIFNLTSLVFLLLLQKQTIAGTEETTRDAAIETGKIVEKDINATASLMRIYADFVRQIIESDLIPEENKRSLIYSEMESIVVTENLDNFWCVVNANRVDGLDSLFANKLGSDSQGHFLPYFVNNDKNIRVIINDINFDSDVFRQMRQTGKEIITEPYVSNNNAIGKETVFTLFVPIKIDGEVIGAVGHDYIVEKYNKYLDDLKEDDKVILKLVSNKGVVTSSNFVRFLGKPAEGGDPEILGKMAKGEAFEGVYTGTGEALYSVFNPLQMGRTDTPWYFVSAIPEREFYAQGNTFMLIMGVLNLVGILIVIVVIVFILRSVLNGFTSVTGTIHQLSEGHINVKMSDQQNGDEVGQMNSEMNRLVKGLQSMASFADHIGKGNLEVDFQPLSDDDVLGQSLLEMRDNLYKAQKENEHHQKEEEQRSWGTQGVAKFAEILRQDNDNLETLSYNIISNLVKYIGANQGGIFILNEDEGQPFLELTACYAYDRKKFLEKKVEPGEGLVGTCYVEGEPIYMTDVPGNYITITSGLGDNNPSAILITPLKINDEIYGVIEIAAFTPFEQYQLEFMNKLGESIAATISSVKVNIRTNKLLETSKIQAEEMANQEEELRQNMEEMQATQEEMRRREAELSSTLEEMKTLQEANAVSAKNMGNLYDSLSKSFNLLEFSSEGIITDVNESTLKSMNVTREECIGMPMSTFVPNEDEILVHMKKGECFDTSITTEYEGRSYTTKNLFVPFMDVKGNLERFILVFYSL